MTQVFDEAGAAIPVTVIHAGPCHVLQLRTKERDGYEAIQLGFLDKARSKVRRSERGHVANIGSKRAKNLAAAGRPVLAKAGCEPKRYVRELRGPIEGYQVGQQIKVDVLAEVKAVDVTAITKGRGFQGVIKRHGFAGLRATHGTKKVQRSAGSVGGRAGWRGGGRPKKGKRLPGQMGNVRVTTRNLKVVRVDQENDLLLLRGAVPGPNGGLVVIRQTNKTS